ncbi:MAG: metallopeptidase [Ruminococcus sp.]|nr:metallopeptidase [Ruminococcus sp.]
MKKSEKIIKLSGEVLRFSRNTLLVGFRFLDAALSRLEYFPNDDISFGTDGKFLVYNPEYLLRRYAENSNNTVHDYLHSLLHCIFRHNFVSPSINRRLWNLACDIAVEGMMREFRINSLETEKSDKISGKLHDFEKNIPVLTAEKIYKYFQDNNLTEPEIKTLENIFTFDDHRLWYMTGSQKSASGIGNNNKNNDDSNNDNSDKNNNINDNYGSEEDWKDIAERIQVDMETLSQKQGENAGGLLQNLREVNREKYDYTAFLKKFAVMGEAMQVNDDEFDYIFYTYGLKLYKNMPLIEPLEYKEVKRIMEFIIAIDTSGSVSGELVQTFLKKTYNIMKQTESFFSKINIHIIQCDAEIQEHIKITSQEEFDSYLKNMHIHGLGGTDFRPVFSLVDRLIAEKEFTNLKGLIYFTDGYGDFPSRKPSYETAFAFIEEEWNNYDVPPWAIKLILRKDEI